MNPPVALPNPLDPGKFVDDTAGDAGCDDPKLNALVGGALEGVNENPGWNVDGLVGVELVCCANGLLLLLLAGALLVGGAPKLNGDGPVADVGGVKPNEPVVVA